jgi:succinyl-CoA synthetase beta subunit
MRLYEFESKIILKEYGIPVPRGFVISTNEIHSMSAVRLKFPWYLKAQVPVGGRGKAGGIVRVKDTIEAKTQLPLIFNKTINGYGVKTVLIEEAVDATKELYLSVTINREKRSYSIIAGSMGGMDIEEIAERRPETILNLLVSPLRKINDFDILAISNHFGIPFEQISPIVSALYDISLSLDAELVEINPLELTKEGLVALDAKILIDDNALFRHPAFMELPARGRSKEEEAAVNIGLNYVSLNGDIGIIGNGAGLVMATMDLLKSKGGRPANFLDVGAGAKADKFKEGVVFLVQNKRVKALFINIFGGLTRCDEVAKGIVEAVIETDIKKPTVVRLAGTNDVAGRRILESIGMTTFADPLEAAMKVISLVSDKG